MRRHRRRPGLARRRAASLHERRHRRPCWSERCSRCSGCSSCCPPDFWASWAGARSWPSAASAWRASPSSAPWRCCCSCGASRADRRERAAHPGSGRRCRGCQPELAGLRIVQISDLHIGNHLQGERLSRWVERGERLTSPDVIVLTGDIFDFDPAFIEDGARRLGDAPRPATGSTRSWATTTSTPAPKRWPMACAAWRRGMRLLRDEIVKSAAPGAAVPRRQRGSRPGLDRARPCGSRPWNAWPTPAPGRRPDPAPGPSPRALRPGPPSSAFRWCWRDTPTVARWRCRLPGGRYNLARVVTPLTRGSLPHQGASTLYVNRGLGVGGPAVRINCPREIATIELA